MGRIPYDPVECAKTHKIHYGSGLPVFRGEFRQQGGYGLGNLFAGLARQALPILAPIAKNVARTAIKTGGRIFTDVLTGQDSLKSSAKKRIAQAVSNELDKPPSSSKRRRKRSRTIDKNLDIFD